MSRGKLAGFPPRIRFSIYRGTKNYEVSFEPPRTNRQVSTSQLDYLRGSLGRRGLNPTSERDDHLGDIE